MIELKPLIAKDYVNITRVHSLQDVDTLLMPWFYLCKEVGFDVETTMVKEFFDRKVRTIQFGNKKRQFLIDLLDFTDGDAELLAECQGWHGMHTSAAPKLKALLARLDPIVCSNDWLKVGVNLGFEFTCFYWNFGMMPWNLYGCDIVERVKWAGAHSLEDFGFFSMEEMMARYFGVQIDKALQTSFTIDQPLTDDQADYAVLDTRMPIGIKQRQLNGYERENGTHVNGIIEDGLLRISEIENNVIMSFEQMHVHGEKLDIAAWVARTDEKVAERVVALVALDKQFIPLVGSKTDIVTEEEVEEATALWKAIKDTKDEVRAELKEIASNLGKLRTQQKKAASEAQGTALVNYGSPAQLLKILRAVPGLKSLKSTDDEELVKFEGVPIIDALRDYRELDKQITTYGYAWTKEWSTHACNEEGWLSPFTHKLHARFNQLLAVTGRSSSDRPNGQNLPRDKKVRMCFIAELGMVYITADMAGAELRILAELSKALTWINAFARGEDLHSVGCEVLFPVEWPAEQCAGEDLYDSKGKLTHPNYFCEYYALHTEKTAAKVKRPDLVGTVRHAKCECPKHKIRREVTKAINFLLAYGGTAVTLAARIGVTVEAAELLMASHAEKFPDVHAYLDRSGKNAVRFFKAFDMFGRRRTFPVPDAARGRDKIIKYWKDSIKLPKAVSEANVAKWSEEHKIVTVLKSGKEKIKLPKPTGETKFWLTHREPNNKEIQKAIRSILNGIEREGKNHEMQGTNVTIAKLAMGAGFDKNGKPYLFHILPTLNAKLVKFVHDELVVTSPPETAEQVAFEIGDAFKRAAAEVMHKVVMEFEYVIADFWSK